MFREIKSGSLLALSISFAFLFVTSLAIFAIFSTTTRADTCPVVDGLRCSGGVGWIANPGGSGNPVNTSTACGGNIRSCGTYPTCYDLSQVLYCVNGHLVQPYCSSNRPQNQTTTNPCQPTTNFVLKASGHDRSDKQLSLLFYSPGTRNNPVFTATFTGNSTIASPLPFVDSEIDFDNSYVKIFMKSLNVTALSAAGTNEIDIERVGSGVTIPISGVNVDKSYLVQLPSSFSYTSLIFNVSYSDVSVSNASNLVLYRCENYNFATGNCDSGWQQQQGVTIDSANKVLSVPLTSFSVYSLAEQAPGTATTTTTSSTTSSSTSTSTSTQSSDSSNNNNYQQPTQVFTSGGGPTSSEGAICNTNADCCGGKTAGSYTCTPGGCLSCASGSVNCYSCSNLQPSTTSPSPSSSSTSATSTTTPAKTNSSTLMFSLPSFSFSIPNLSSMLSKPLEQNSTLTFIVGLVTGIAIVWFFLSESGQSLILSYTSSYSPPSQGGVRGLKGYRKIYSTRRIDSGRGMSRSGMNARVTARKYKSYGETKLVLD